MPRADTNRRKGIVREAAELAAKNAPALAGGAGGDGGSLGATASSSIQDENGNFRFMYGVSAYDGPDTYGP